MNDEINVSDSSNHQLRIEPRILHPGMTNYYLIFTDLSKYFSTKEFIENMYAVRAILL